MRIGVTIGYNNPNHCDFHGPPLGQHLIENLLFTGEVIAHIRLDANTTVHSELARYLRKIALSLALIMRS